MFTRRSTPNPSGFTYPIGSLTDAVNASAEAYGWRGQSVQDSELITDRLIEIVAFRATQLWADHHGPHEQSGMLFLSPPVFDTQQQSPQLFVPVMGYPELGLGKSHGGRATFYDNATCQNILGSMLLGEVFRRVMCARFGPPIGISATQHIRSQWPEPPLWHGVDTVLAAMMIPDHRVRREARLLELSTHLSETAPSQRRL